MSNKMQEISLPPDQQEAADEAREIANKLRNELRENCLELDTSNIEKQLVQEVVRYTTPEARIEQIKATTSRDNKTAFEADRLEHNALIGLINARKITACQFGSDTGPGLTLAALEKSSDLPTLIDEIKLQAERLTSNDKEAIKELLAQQAVLAHHVGQHTIQKSINAPTTEGRAITAKHGVNMLEISSRIVEKLARIDQPKPGNVYANQANIAHNQVIQNGRNIDVINEPEDNVKSHNQLLEANDDTRSNLSRLDTRKEAETVGSDTEMEAVGTIYRTKK